MPKHAFKFPREVLEAIKHHVRSAVEGLPPERYRQEPNYTAALLGRLEGVAYEGNHGKVTLSATVFDDRGPNSAESKYGADHAITATISDGTTTITKAILVQAKLGHISDLSNRDHVLLRDQIKKMKNVIPSPKIMEIPEFAGKRYPAIISGNRVLADEDYTAMQLPEYFVARVITTLDGCTDPEVVAAVKDSKLSRLNVLAKIRTQHGA